jgi:hypothetical protein
MLFKNSVRTSKRTPHFTITKINWLTLFKFNRVTDEDFGNSLPMLMMVVVFWLLAPCISETLASTCDAARHQNLKHNLTDEEFRFEP